MTKQSFIQITAIFCKVGPKDPAAFAVSIGLAGFYNWVQRGAQAVSSALRQASRDHQATIILYRADQGWVQ